MNKENKISFLVLASAGVNVVHGIISFILFVDSQFKPTSPTAIIAAIIIVSMIIGGIYGITANIGLYDNAFSKEEQKTVRKVGVITLMVVLTLSLVFITLEIYFRQQDQHVLRVILPWIAILLTQGLLIGEYKEFNQDSKSKDNSKEEENDEYSREKGSIEYTHVVSFEKLHAEFTEIGIKCENVSPQMDRANNQIRILNDIGKTIKDLQQLAYKKSALDMLPKTFEHLVEYVYQNLRDVFTICIAGRAISEHHLKKTEIETIKKELRHNDDKINKFKNVVSQLATTAIQQNSACSDLDIDSEIISIAKYAELKNGEDCLSNTPPQTGTR